jgi:hypothetical protein
VLQFNKNSTKSGNEERAASMSVKGNFMLAKGALIILRNG